MKADILKIAGVKSEKEFYKKYPSEESFMKVHGKEFKKAQQGASIMAALGQAPKQGLGFTPGQQNIGMPKSLGYNLSGNATGQQMDFSGNPIQGLSAQQSLTSQGMSGMTDIGGKAPGMMGKLMENANLPGKIISGIKAIKAEKAKRKSAEQWEDVSDIQLQASRTRPEETRRQYVRPEDMVNTGEEFFPVYGVGTNALAKDGTVLRNKVGGNRGEIQNTYDPNTLYDDLGYAPLQKANFGAIATGVGGDMFGQVTKELYGQNAGSELGGDLGGAVGSIWGPVGQVVGKEVGKLAGWALDRNPAKIKKAQDATMRNVGSMAFANQMQGVQGQNVSHMEEGGWISNDWQPQVITQFGEHKLSDLLKKDRIMDTLRTGGNIRENSGYPDFAMGGDLKVYRGEATPISQNPYLPDGGETVMFRGPSHAEGGMPIKYGNSPVEVEGGEPAVKLQDGGMDESLIVFGNLPISGQYATMLGDSKVKGMKFKNYIKDLSATENKQNKIIDKSVNKLDDLNIQSSFDKISADSFKANIDGANMKLKDLAAKKQTAAALQQAINETADEQGLVAEDLARGTVKLAKKGALIKKAQDGEALESLSREDYDRLIKLYEQASKDKTGKSKAVEEFQREFTRIAPNRAKSALKKVGMGPTNYAKSLDPDLGAFDPLGNIDQYWGPRTEAYRAAMEESLLPTPGEQITLPEDTPDVTGILPTFIENKPVVEDTIPTTKKKKYEWIEALASAIPALRPSDREGLDARQLAGEMFALSSNQLEPVPFQRFTPQLTVPYDISLQDILNENQAAFRSAQRTMGYNPAAQANLAAQQYQANQRVLGEQFRMNQAEKNRVYEQNRQILDQAQLTNLGQYAAQADKQAAAKSATKATTQMALNSIADKFAKNQLENRTLATYENLYNYRFGPDMIAQNWNAPFRPNMPTVETTPANQPAETKAKAKEKSNARNGAIVRALKSI